MNLNRAKKINRLAASTVFYDDSMITIPTLQVLNQDGSIVDGASEPALSRDQASKIYSDMLYIRLLDERMVSAQRQGRLSFYLTCTGEEAAVAGTIAAFDAQDMVMAQYREQLALRYRGFSLSLIHI